MSNSGDPGYKKARSMKNDPFGFKSKIYHLISSHVLICFITWRFIHLVIMNRFIRHIVNVCLKSRMIRSIVYQLERLLLVLALERLKNLMLKMRTSMPLVSIGILIHLGSRYYVYRGLGFLCVD